MFEFRVSKYDPRHRNEAGDYLLDEWTEFSEVGETVSMEVYEQVEDAYIQSAGDFALTWSSKRILIHGLECSRGTTSLSEGQLITMGDLPWVLRSILRSECWCRLEVADGFIHIGWDYYMYLGVSVVEPAIINATEKRGLFVEECRSPYHTESSLDE